MALYIGLKLKIEQLHSLSGNVPLQASLTGNILQTSPPLSAQWNGPEIVFLSPVQTFSCILVLWKYWAWGVIDQILTCRLGGSSPVDFCKYCVLMWLQLMQIKGFFFPFFFSFTIFSCTLVSVTHPYPESFSIFTQVTKRPLFCENVI